MSYSVDSHEFYHFGCWVVGGRAGSPAGSTPVDALLHGVIQMMGEDDKDHTSSNQDAAYTASKRRTMMAAKNRVRGLQVDQRGN